MGAITLGRLGVQKAPASEGGRYKGKKAA